MFEVLQRSHTEQENLNRVLNIINEKVTSNSELISQIQKQLKDMKAYQNQLYSNNNKNEENLEKEQKQK